MNDIAVLPMVIVTVLMGVFFHVLFVSVLKTGPKNKEWEIEHGRIKREVSTSNFHSVIWGVLLLSIFFLRRSGIFFLAMGYLMLGHLGKG